MNGLDESSRVIWNVPNVLSMGRLFLSMLLFVAIPCQAYQWALVLFCVAAGTDWLDGWWARRYQQITQLGRILDPFCDKILICGAFVLLAESMSQVLPWYQRITGWMAVVVVGRELLITGLRSFIESAGSDFSAKMSGKLKMVFQCAAVILSLIVLQRPELQVGTKAIEMVAQPWDAWIIAMVVMIWVSVLSTVHSGWLYVQLATRLLRQSPKA